MEIPARQMVVVLVVMIAVAAEKGSGITVCKFDEAGQEACRPSVTKPNPVPPSEACCKAISAADLPCLCSYKSNPMLPTIGIDPDLAFALPSKCNVHLPAGC